ncbi:hypothetical protein GCM10023232_23480 [Sphingosinicella ginsenosidimutans]|uniref:Uncharacterized protein n=1 Tax=Allosphingosinicella ginsenosidimutans TaxID=1176539 RepID=A0A5C6TT18_9SPHN|nr:hypothetical protein [Sphingosinicella ginsenosidimutans]TXC63572.1 hypothetical protein FRZ32_07790 [Sphingosinicella ginsenosidimutans]
MNNLAKAALAAAAMLVPGAAAAQPAIGNVRISAQIPVVCNIDSDDFAIDSAMGQAQGTVREFCNAAQGFVVMASYRPLEPGEEVRVSYDGETSELAPGGMSAVAFRSGPRLRTIPVLVRSTGLQSGISVALGMTPV